MVGRLSTHEIENMLHRNRVGRIGCTDGETPYVIPVLYGYEDNTLYVCSRNGRKIDMMRHHPRVCFEVDEVEQMDGRGPWRSIVIDGLYEELTSPEDEALALDQLGLGSTPRLDISDDHANGLVLFRIRAVQKSGRFGEIP